MMTGFFYPEFENLRIHTKRDMMDSGFFIPNLRIREFHLSRHDGLGILYPEFKNLRIISYRGMLDSGLFIPNLRIRELSLIAA